MLFEETPAHLAFTRGYFSLVEYLVQHGADVNKTSLSGRNLLYLAFETYQFSMLELLMSHGADVNKY